MLFNVYPTRETWATYSWKNIRNSKVYWPIHLMPHSQYVAHFLCMCVCVCCFLSRKCIAIIFPVFFPTNFHNTQRKMMKMQSITVINVFYCISFGVLYQNNHHFLLHIHNKPEQTYTHIHKCMTILANNVDLCL